LWVELGPFSDAARDDRRDGRSKGQQEEELDQLVAVADRKLTRGFKKTDAVCDLVSDKKIGDGGDSKV